MIRGFASLVGLCIVALVAGAPAWLIYVGACTAITVLLIQEKK